MTNTMKPITTEEFDEKFDNGEDISDYLDIENAKASMRILLPIKLRSILMAKAKEQNKSLEELIVSILDKSVLY